MFNSRTNAMFYNGMMSQRAAPSVSMFHSVWSSPAQFDAEKSSSHDSNASSVDSMWSFGSIWSPKHTPTSTETAPFADSSDKDWSDILKSEFGEKKGRQSQVSSLLQCHTFQF